MKRRRVELRSFTTPSVFLHPIKYPSTLEDSLFFIPKSYQAMCCYFHAQFLFHKSEEISSGHTGFEVKLSHLSPAQPGPLLLHLDFNIMFLGQ